MSGAASCKVYKDFPVSREVPTLVSRFFILSFIPPPLVSPPLWVWLFLSQMGPSQSQLWASALLISSLLLTTPSPANLIHSLVQPKIIN